MRHATTVCQPGSQQRVHVNWRKTSRSAEKYEGTPVAGLDQNIFRSQYARTGSAAPRVLTYHFCASAGRSQRHLIAVQQTNFTRLLHPIIRPPAHFIQSKHVGSSQNGFLVTPHAGKRQLHHHVGLGHPPQLASHPHLPSCSPLPRAQTPALFGTCRYHRP